MVLLIQWNHHLLQIALCFMLFEIKDISRFPAKIQDGGQISEESKFFRGHRAVVLSTKGVQYLPQIALSLMVFQISDIFHFRQNSRWWLKFGEV